MTAAAALPTWDEAIAWLRANHRIIASDSNWVCTCGRESEWNKNRKTAQAGGSRHLRAVRAAYMRGEVR